MNGELDRCKCRLHFGVISIGVGLIMDDEIRGSPMRLLLLSLVVLAWNAAPISAPAPSAPLQTPAVAAPVDADVLHEQASLALERLRQTRERRVAMATPAAL